MCLRKIALVIGIAFVAVGALGFVPAVTPDGLLFKLFEVDKIHNSVHLVTGFIALIAASREAYAKIYFQVFGVVYAAVAVAGFARTGDLWWMHVNHADNFLHLGIAVVALYFGFVAKPHIEE